MSEGSAVPLKRDRSFWGMTATQFLGAFNDNVFKQLVLLICVDYVALQGLDHDRHAVGGGGGRVGCARARRRCHETGSRRAGAVEPERTP